MENRLHFLVVVTVLLLFQQARGEIDNSFIKSIERYFSHVKLALCEYPEHSLPSCDVHRPRNCADIQDRGDTQSGVRTIYPCSDSENHPVSVYCDQTSDGGGWTVFQHRENLPQREDFFRKWTEYKLGFGNLTGEFWLGLENIHALVEDILMELKVDLEDYEGVKKWAKYDYFYISDDSDKYRLELGKYSGNAGDSFGLHNGQKFSTKDQDNDSNAPENCAQIYKGAWWYNACHGSNLNGYQYVKEYPSYADGIDWDSFKGHHYSLKKTSMSLRPRYRS